MAHSGAQTWATGMFGAGSFWLVNVSAATVPSSVRAPLCPHFVSHPRTPRMIFCLLAA
jgi:hypothetical protein